MELTVTFDDHNIPLRPRRLVKPKNYPEGKIFGTPLATLLANDRKREPSAQIPLVFQEVSGGGREGGGEMVGRREGGRKRERER